MFSSAHSSEIFVVRQNIGLLIQRELLTNVPDDSLRLLERVRIGPISVEPEISSGNFPFSLIEILEYL